MTTTPKHDKRVAELSFTAVYPHYVTKVEKKGRTVAEMNQVITWLTGFDEAEIQKQIDKENTFAQLFAEASLNPNTELMKGMIYGHRIEEIETPATRLSRYLDELIAILARVAKWTRF